ncbi:MAG: inner rane transporter RhtA [Nocardioidaceae bacterium]|nr:inner rane transporter RhtA [Nocardioidaceae bacterium]
MSALSARSPARLGTGMAVGSMLTAQIGLALSMGLIHDVGAAGAAWLRLVWAALIFLALARPRLSELSRETLRAGIPLGIVTAGVTMLFMAALTHLSLGTASALEFLGPLGVAVARSRGLARAWVALAAAGILCLTQPWSGAADAAGIGFALGAACCWAAYILLTQRIGDTVSGVRGLAISMPVAALVATVVAGPHMLPRLTPELLVAGLGIAILLPVVPFSLEMLALRRLTTGAFGTLMALEPAFALIIGFLVLHQRPDVVAVLGVFLVVGAGIGAERSGARHVAPPSPVDEEALPPVPSSPALQEV